MDWGSKRVKELMLLSLVMALMLTGCKQKGFETDIDLTHSNSSAVENSSSIPEFEESSSTPDMTDNADNTDNTDETGNDQGALGTHELPDITLPAVETSDSNMSTIYGITFDSATFETVSEEFDKAGISLGKSTIYRGACLSGLNVSGLQGIAVWEHNDLNAAVVLGKLSNAYAEQTALDDMKNAKETLFSLVKESDEFTDEHLINYNTIQYGVRDGWAYFILPGLPTADSAVTRTTGALEDIEGYTLGEDRYKGEDGIYLAMSDEIYSRISKSLGLDDNGVGYIEGSIEESDSE